MSEFSTQVLTNEINHREAVLVSGPTYLTFHSVLQFPSLDLVSI